MKKSVLFLMICMSVIVGLAQNPVKRTYDYSKEVMEFFGKSPVNNRNSYFLFPDTGIIIRGETPTRPHIHSIANITDISVGWLNDESKYAGKMQYTKGASYTLDTVGLYGVYVRNNSNADVVDTLIFEIVTQSFNNIYKFGKTTPYAEKYGLSSADTAWFANLPYQRNEGKINYTTQKYTVLLRAGGENNKITSGYYEGYQYFYITPKIAISSAPVFMTAVIFKPGYAYTSTDILQDQNYIEFYATKESPIGSYRKGFYNSSYILNTYNKYYQMPASYDLLSNDKPGTESYFEHIPITYSVGCTGCGYVSVRENTQKTVSIYPNPATDVVNIQLNSGAPSKVELINLTGQTVIVQDVMSEAVKIDISTVKRGIYMLKITQEEKTQTSKLVIK